MWKITANFVTKAPLSDRYERLKMKMGPITSLSQSELSRLTLEIGHLLRDSKNEREYEIVTYCYMWASHVDALPIYTRKGAAVLAIDYAKKTRLKSNYVHTALYNLGALNFSTFQDPNIDSEQLIKDSIELSSTGDWESLLEMVEYQRMLNAIRTDEEDVDDDIIP